MWVGHDEGASNIGCHLTNRSVDGKRYPMQQFLKPDKQTLYHTKISNEGESKTQVIWRSNLPLKITGITIKIEDEEGPVGVLFWGYDPEELSVIYDAAEADPSLNSIQSLCFPPGRIQSIKTNVNGEPHIIKVLSGANVPSYSGCNRILFYATETFDVSNPFVVERLISGSDDDGLGVPTKQCCPRNLRSSFSSNAYDLEDPRQAGLMTAQSRSHKRKVSSLSNSASRKLKEEDNPAGGDPMMGGEGGNQMMGGEGGNPMTGGEGGNPMMGGEGGNQMMGGEGSDPMTGGEGNQMMGGEGGNPMMGGEGGDPMTGGEGNQMMGGEGGNPMMGGEGGNQMMGGEGNQMMGGEGGDPMMGGEGGNPMTGGEGGDPMMGGEGGNQMMGGEGGDPMMGGEGGNPMTGGEGGDPMMGGEGGDPMTGGEGGDPMMGGEGGDPMMGGEGGNQMMGGEGGDPMMGGEGGDPMMGGEGGNQMMGGEGGDPMMGGEGGNPMTGGEGGDPMMGGEGGDPMMGGEGGNQMMGGEGGDPMMGGEGGNQMMGGEGGDPMMGGEGGNPMTGGEGGDPMMGGEGGEGNPCDGGGEGPHGGPSDECGPKEEVYDSPKGCLSCSDYQYSNYIVGDRLLYSTSSVWSHPHSGWWFTGYQSMWKDNRLSDDISSSELYRPGGFAWREAWPELLGIWEMQPIEQRDDCETCQEGYYGANCLYKCPIAHCSTKSVDKCLPPACHWHGEEEGCIGEMCSGYGCNEGIHGNGTCLCPFPNMGDACELGHNTGYEIHEIFVTADAPVFISKENAGESRPTFKQCSSHVCGVSSDEPCCGRSPEPMRVSPEDFIVLSFTEMVLPKKSASEIMLTLFEAPGICPQGESTTLHVYYVHDFPPWVEDVRGRQTESLLSTSLFRSVDLSAYPLVAEIALDRPTAVGEVQGFGLDLSYFTSDVTDVTFVVFGSSSTCVPRFAPREYSDNWVESCSFKPGCIAGGIPPTSASVPIEVYDQYAPRVQFVFTEGETGGPTGGEGDPMMGGEGDPMTGGEGGDPMMGGEGGDPMMGGEGGDPMMGGEGGDPMMGGEGGDPMMGGEGGDPMMGGEGGDPMMGGEGGDPMMGGEGGDPMMGGEGGDPMMGGEGGDPMMGGEGGDPMMGGEGGDPMMGGEGGNPMMGGEGGEGDPMTGEGGGSAPSDMDGEGGDPMMGGEGGNQMGGGGGDPMMGGEGGNQMGGEGGDPMTGGEGGNQMGGGGGDPMMGGEGGDPMTGGEGGNQMGGGGGDPMMGGEGGNQMGGEGGNPMMGGEGGNPMMGGEGGNPMMGGEGGNQMGGEGGDPMMGGEGGDPMTGGEGGNQMGGGGGDPMTGGEGGNQMGGGGGDPMMGGEGGNQMGGEGGNPMMGGEGGNPMMGGEGGNPMMGGEGGNQMGGEGGDPMMGGEGGDPMMGGEGGNQMGGGGGDPMMGGEGGNPMMGGEGGNQMGGEGGDPMTGGEGGNQMGGGGGDPMMGGEGGNQMGGEGGDPMMGGEGGNQMGGEGGDPMTGGEGGNQMGGEGGNPMMGGEGGNQMGGGGGDPMMGGEGGNQMGGEGGDPMTGGEGGNQMGGGGGDPMMGGEGGNQMGGEGGNQMGGGGGDPMMGGEGGNQMGGEGGDPMTGGEGGNQMGGGGGDPMMGGEGGNPMMGGEGGNQMGGGGGDPMMGGEGGNQMMGAGAARKVLQTESETPSFVVPLGWVGEEEIFREPSCTSLTTDETEGCTMMAPIVSGFVIIRIMGYSTKVDYSLAIKYTPVGNFGIAQKLGECSKNPETGYWGNAFCLDCDFRYTGDTCQQYNPDSCNDMNCSPMFGTCVNDIETGGVYQKCECNDMFYGLSCSKMCDASSPVAGEGCNNHGTCTNQGTCHCFDSELEGHWSGVSCDICTEGWFKESCITPCSCGNGKCNTTSPDGACMAGSCFGNFVGKTCKECKIGFYGAACTKVCNEETCEVGKGECTTSGDCKCLDDNGWYADPHTRECTLFCDHTTCGHGRCPVTGEAVVPGRLCYCDSTAEAGFWDPATDCSTCTSSYWGSDCTNECRCNRHGKCKQLTGECLCYDDDTLGHFEGDTCQRCKEGFTGDCKSQGSSIGSPIIGKGYDFVSKNYHFRNPDANGMRGSIFHINSIEIEAQHMGKTYDASGIHYPRKNESVGTTKVEYLLASAGKRKATTNIVPVEIWMKPLDTSLDFRNRYLLHFGAHTTDTFGAILGEVVIGIFHDLDYLYLVVQDSKRSFLGRIWSVDTADCRFCLAPSIDQGIQYKNILQGLAHTASDLDCSKGCNPGQQVALIEPGTGNIISKGVVLERKAGGYLVRVEDSSEMTISEDLIKPLPSVGWMHPDGNWVQLGQVSDPTHVRGPFKVISWDFITAFHLCVTLVKQTDSDTGSVTYHIRTFGTLGAALSLRDTYQVRSFSEVTNMAIVKDNSPYALLMGTGSSGRITLQKIFLPTGSGGEDSFRQVLNLVPPVCDVYTCLKVEKIVLVTQHLQHWEESSALVFVETETTSETDGFTTTDTAYAVQRVVLSQLKRISALPDLNHYSCYNRTEQNCTSSRSCTWMSTDTIKGCVVRSIHLLKSTSGRQGIGACVLDSNRNFYYTVGSRNPDKASIIFKTSLDTFETIFQREMYTGFEPEVIVSGNIDVPRRGIFMVSHMSTLRISVINTYEVFSPVVPNVADAPSAGTIITVTGDGFSDMDKKFNPKCLLGTQVANAWFRYLEGGEIQIICLAAKPTQGYSQCSWVSLEVALNDEDIRWTETKVPMKRIDTPLIMGFGASNYTGSWIFPHDSTVPEISNQIELSDYRRLAITTPLAIPGPEVDPFGGRHPQLIQTLPTGPYNKGVVITVKGAGFFESQYSLCHITTFPGKELIYVSPGTYLTAVKMLCYQPPTAKPYIGVIEVAMDGQIYSENGVTYRGVGEAVKMEAFALCSNNPSDPKCMNQIPVNQSSLIVPLPWFACIFRDEMNTFVGSVWARDVLGYVQISSKQSGLNISKDSVTAVMPSNGSVIFNQLVANMPSAGTYELEMIYYELGVQKLEPVYVTLEILGGEPTKAKLVTYPTKYANNREPFTVQPEISVMDEANNNILNENWKVKATISINTLPRELVDNNGAPVIVLESGLSPLSADTGMYSYRFLKVSSSTVRGRALQVRQTGPYTDELLEFTIVYTVVDVNGIAVPQLPVMSSSHHMVDCSADYVGKEKLSWILPEEQPKGSTVPFRIKGWFFTEPAPGMGLQYYCIMRNAATNAFMYKLDAVFEDSCTLLCSTPSATDASMTVVQPALCCAAGCDEQSCGAVPSGAIIYDTPFNETSLKEVAYHKYVGSASQAKVWNLMTFLPEPLPSASPYSFGLVNQISLQQIAPIDAAFSNALRTSSTGYYELTQYDYRSGFKYYLLLRSNSIINKNTVIRSSQWSFIAGTKIGEENDWLMASQVAQLRSGAADTRFRVAFTDSVIGINNWDGNYVSYTKFLDMPADVRKNTQEITSVTIEILPILTMEGPDGLQQSSVKEGFKGFPTLSIGGVTLSGNTHSKRTNFSYVEFEEVAMRYPIKGTYLVTFRPSDPAVSPVQVTIKVLEGIPYKAVFDEPRFEWPNSRDGLPTSTLTNSRRLTIQPRFRLIDISDNTLNDFPSVNSVYVRVLSITPWPRCLPEPAAGGQVFAFDPGMWGVVDRTNPGLCAWNTPPLSDTTVEAIAARLAADPEFDATGIAEYGLSTEGSVEMNIWAQEGESYEVEFEFYGPGLQLNGYTLPNLKTPQRIAASRCAPNCINEKICELDPPEFGNSHLNNLWNELVIYGDYYDFAQSGGSDASLRMMITTTVDQKQFQCEIQPRLRDPCSLVADVPTCEYLCLNFFSGYTAQDRQSCCTKRVKADGGSCGNIFASRGVQMLQAASTSPLTSPSTRSLQVSTNCGGTTSCASTLAAVPPTVGPSTVGAPEQLGVSENMTTLSSCMYFSFILHWFYLRLE